LLQKIHHQYKNTLAFPKEREKDAESIQVKIIIVLKYWVETQIDDFDEDLIAKLNKLLEVMSQDGTQRTKQLRHVLEKRVAERNERAQLMFKKPEQIQVGFLSFLINQFSCPLMV
jgi:hypothetical protein